jgi:hypothetical protein
MRDFGMLSQVKEEIIIFIVRPEKEIINVILQIDAVLKGYKKMVTKNMIFIPGENHDIIDYMIQTQLYNDYNIESLNFDIIPIDIDLLSLERDNCIKEIYIDNNYSSISDLACALVKLETCFGKVKNKYVKGDLAQAFCKIVEEKEIENNLNAKGEILGMIVLDRSVDFITLMTTNYTCEGLIDEKFGINLGKIKVEEKILKKNLTKKPIDSTKLIPYGLTSKINPLYCSMRCMHYKDAYAYMDTIKEYYQKIAKASNNKSLSLDKIKEYTEKLNHFMVKIKVDLIMNENIMDCSIEPLKDPNYTKYVEKEQLMLSGDLPSNLYSYYEEHLYEQRDLMTLIKLMILENLTQNGVKDYQKLKREILNIYGYQNIFLFRDLENLGWLKERELLKDLRKIIDITYNQISQKLELMKLSDDPKKIDDCSYVMGGFCPIGLRIIEMAIDGKWIKIMDTLKKMPGATECPPSESVFASPKDENNIIFVVFVGGVTYTEIEGIRFLNRKLNEEYKNKKRKKKKQLIILTTGVLNYKKIFAKLGKDIHTSLTMKSFYEDNQK